MAKRTVEFVLSEETAESLQSALEQLKRLKANGFSLTDIRIEERDQAGVTIGVGVIEAST